MTAAGPGTRRSENEGDFFLCEVAGRPKDTEEEQISLGQVKAPPQKRRAVTRVESAKTQDCVSAEGVMRHPYCSQRATLGPAHVR